MGKKLYFGLAPLLATAAFALTPAAAQALAPHWFSEGSEIPKGTVVETLAWGQLTLEAEPASVAPTTCLNVAGADIENPVDGSAGRGETTNFATYDCTNAECPAGEILLGPGVEAEKEFNVISPPQDLPWPSELIGTAPKFKLNSTGVVVELECDARHITPGHKPTGCTNNDEGLSGPGLPCTPQGAYTKKQIHAGADGENELFPLAAPVVCVTTPTHLQDPETVNGTNKGNNQSRLVFNQPAGSGLSCAGGAITGKTSQSLKTMGYNGSELITTKNS